MMDKRYTRLKLKMLLLVVAGTLGALAAALFLWEMVAVSYTHLTLPTILLV